MANIIVPGQPLLFMKVGIHAKESLEDIIARKMKEIDDAGYSLWGYGGNTCHPNSMVQPFAKDAAAKGQQVFLVMHEMVSNHFADPVRADEFSVDGENWERVHDDIHVLGSRYALAIKNLRLERHFLPLESTSVALGQSIGRAGNKYIQGRVDKACLLMGDVNPDPQATPGLQIDLVAELCEPYAVFLRNTPKG